MIQALRDGEEKFLGVIHDGAHEGIWNMAVDEFLFRNQTEARNPNAILRFYRFSKPALTVGYGAWRALRSDLQSGLRLIRRITGGGIVRHESDLVYTLVAPIAIHPSLGRAQNAYPFIHELLMTTLFTFGISTECFKPSGKRETSSFCFEAPVPFDVMLGDKKVAGAGQKRSNSYLLHQGSIEWSTLVAHAPNLSEDLFVRRFSTCLAQRFDVPIRDLPFPVQERGDTSRANGYARATA